MIFYVVNRGDRDHMPHSAASDLCLYVLPISQKMDAMLGSLSNFLTQNINIVFCYVLMKSSFTHAY